MSNEFLSYTEALSELSLSRDELNDLVAKGELRAFHEGDEVRFKSEDILGLKKSRETEPTIVRFAASCIDQTIQVLLPRKKIALVHVLQRESCAANRS